MKKDRKAGYWVPMHKTVSHDGVKWVVIFICEIIVINWSRLLQKLLNYLMNES